MLSLSSSRKKTEPQQVHLRRDRVILPGLDRHTLIRTHPVRLAQRRRDYNRLVQNYERQRERGLGDVVELVQALPFPRPASTREAIPYINVPGPDQTWQELNEWRAAYGLPPVTS